MTLAGELEVLHLTASLAQRRDDLVRLADGHVGVQLTVHDQDYGTMVALRGKDIVRVPLSEGTSRLKLVSPEEYAEAEVFFG